MKMMTSCTKAIKKSLLYPNFGLVL